LVVREAGLRNEPLHLATGLLPDLTVRHAGRPQRGPLPALVNVAIGVAVLGVAFLLWRRLRRSRPPRRPRRD
jgi:hypothetical protein